MAMYSSQDGSHPSLSEVDAIISLCIKSLDNADQITHHAHAQLVGHVLSSTKIERAAPVPEAPQKTKKDQELIEDDPPASAHSATEAAKPLLTPIEMFLHLSNQLNKSNLTRKTHVGIFDFYVAVFVRLGASFLESNFSLIVAHLISEVILSPRNASRYDVLLTRKLVGILIWDLIGAHMLSEQGQISAIQELANTYLKRWPAMMPGQMAPSSLVLVVVLKEVAGLLQQLGNAPPPVQVRFSSSYFLLTSLRRTFPYRMLFLSRWSLFSPILVTVFM